MDMMAFLGVGIVGMTLAVLLKQYKPEYAPIVSLGTGVVVLLGVASGLAPVFEELGSLLESAGLPMEYGAVLTKSLGICFLTQLAGDACRDAGQIVRRVCGTAQAAPCADLPVRVAWIRRGHHA